VSQVTGIAACTFETHTATATNGDQQLKTGLAECWPVSSHMAKKPVQRPRSRPSGPRCRPPICSLSMSWCVGNLSVCARAASERLKCRTRARTSESATCIQTRIPEPQEDHVKFVSGQTAQGPTLSSMGMSACSFVDVKRKQPCSTWARYATSPDLLIQSIEHRT
jgi:hypothetical protein